MNNGPSACICDLLQQGSKCCDASSLTARSVHTASPSVTSLRITGSMSLLSRFGSKAKKANRSSPIATARKLQLADLYSLFRACSPFSSLRASHGQSTLHRRGERCPRCLWLLNLKSSQRGKRTISARRNKSYRLDYIHVRGWSSTHSDGHSDPRSDASP